MPESILIAGHSHAACLGQLTDYTGESEANSIHLRRLKRGPPDISLFVSPSDERDLIESLAAVASGRTVCLVWRGNFHLAKFLFVNRPGFDFVLSTDINRVIDANCALVPEALVEESLRPAAGDLGAAVVRLQRLEAPPTEIVVVATPPPKGDDDYITQYIISEFGKERYEKLMSGVSGIQLSPANVRYKLWSLMMRLYQTMAVNLGARFLPVPPTCQNEFGYLSPDYYSSDVTHANAKYGQLLLDHLHASLNHGIDT